MRRGHLSSSDSVGGGLPPHGGGLFPNSGRLPSLLFRLNDMSMKQLLGFRVPTHYPHHSQHCTPEPTTCWIPPCVDECTSITASAMQCVYDVLHPSGELQE
jgi:hypothetical protein